MKRLNDEPQFPASRTQATEAYLPPDAGNIGHEIDQTCFNFETCCREYDPDPRILRVLVYIDQTPLQFVTIKEASALVNLSGSRLRHLFKQSTAMSFHQYIRLSRLQRARKLLLESHLRVKEIAATTGAPEISHFVRDYKRVYGHTPTTQRRENTAVVFANR